MKRWSTATTSIVPPQQRGQGGSFQLHEATVSRATVLQLWPRFHRRRSFRDFSDCLAVLWSCQQSPALVHHHMYRVVQKNCTKFMHHNFATVRHRLVRFSAKCPERNCVHGNGQCLNMAIKYSLFCSWQVKYLETKLTVKSFKANSLYRQSSR